MDNTPRQLTPQQMAIHERLATDLRFFAKKCLKVKTKDGKIVPFLFNTAQDHVHNEVERQFEEIGKVRILILKGRQQGCSTYVAARYYQKSTWQGAKSVYILSHESSSTQVLFGKVDLFYQMCPDIAKPKEETANRNQKRFSNLSDYTVGTAGAKNTGRGNTIQFFHGSEAAFYENTDSILTGVFQTIADMPGTEIIIESTANGIGNWFHKACMDALAGKGEYRLVFVPWYWQEEYRTKVPEGWQFDEKEKELQELYGLDDEQLYWRYNKIIELKGEWKFKQEYPFTVAEAFQNSGETFIDPDHIARARKSTVNDPTAPLIMGVDPARKGDRTVLAFRRGREVVKILKYDEMTSMRLAGIIANEIDRMNVVKCFIDFGLGYGTHDRLVELGYGKIVTGVHFGEAPTDRQYLNKRAEMAFELRDWLSEGGVSLPDDEEIDADLLAIPDFKQNSRGLLHLENKDKIVEDYGKSPDIFDALMLTFAYPVKSAVAQNQGPRRTENTKKGSSLSTLNRIKKLGSTIESANWGPPKDPSSVSWRRSRNYDGY